MPKSVKRARMDYVGLCSTCSSDPLCTFPRKPGVPVVQCMEFEGESLHEEVRAGAFTHLKRDDAAPPEHEPGLCPLCDNRPTCTFPKPPGGVWSCEEFR